MKEEPDRELSLPKTPEEVVRLIAEGVTPAITSLPLLMSDAGAGLYLLTVGSAVSAQGIGRIGRSISNFLKTNKAKKEEEAKSAIEKFFETLRFLAKEQPSDEQLLDALKNLHIMSLSKDTNASEVTEIHMLIDIARRLKGEQVLTLLAAYKIGKNLYEPEEIARITEGFDESHKRGNANAWVTMITRALHYTLDGFVQGQEESLEKLQLIHPRVEISAVKRSYEYSHPGCFRLTPLGDRLAESILKGEDLEKVRILDPIIRA